MPTYRSLMIDRFVLKTRKARNGCIVWQSSKNKAGYGTFSVGGANRSALAPRVAYSLFVGPIPDGLCVLHNCPAGDDPACVNPAHLWIGTRADNNADRDKKGRCIRLKGEECPHAKLTDTKVREIRKAYRFNSRSCGIVALAKKHGVGKSVIYSVVKNKIWRHVK